MRKTTMILAAVAIVVLASGPAFATSYYWDGTTNNWNSLHWLDSPGGTNTGTYPTLAADIGYISAGKVYITNGASIAATLQANTGATLDVNMGNNGTATGNFVLNGGTLSSNHSYQDSRGPDLYGTLDVTALGGALYDSTTRSTLNLWTAMSGTGAVTVGGQVYIYGPNSAFSGTLHVTNNNNGQPKVLDDLSYAGTALSPSSALIIDTGVKLSYASFYGDGGNPPPPTGGFTVSALTLGATVIPGSHAGVIYHVMTDYTSSGLVNFADYFVPNTTGGRNFITVQTNAAPVITSLTPDLAIGIFSQPFAFMATATDGDLDPLTFMWDFDGDLLYDEYTGASGSWTYPAPGVYTAAVKVTDGFGGVAYDSFQITVAVPVAEPAGLGLAGLGGLVLLAVKRRRS